MKQSIRHDCCFVVAAGNWRTLPAVAIFLLFACLPTATRAQSANPETTNGITSAQTDLTQNTEENKIDLTRLSIEDLMNIQVTSFRRPVPFSESPAAISVLTQEDIRRSGATSIPEALRLVPGLEVARVDSHQWAISSRGFNDVFANKLLVMIDGRSIYTPLFSGVFWDVQDTMLEDIDRIEVIRGPGATLWGANAVNGVINIITKSAKETQGTLITAGGGTEERGFGAFRYGGKINDEVFYRVYGKYFSRDDLVLPDGGGDANDASEMGRGGFRLDWQPSDPNLFTLQGDIYGGQMEQTFTRLSPMPDLTGMYSLYNDRDKFNVNGGNVLGRWTHTISDESSFSLQTYYDRTFRDTDIFTEKRDTFDVDFQHRFPLGERQDIVWGGGYRLSDDDVGNTFDISMHPKNRTTQLFSTFLQDQISIVPKRLFLTLGSKFEHNDFTGFEFQPGARLLWTPHERHSVWASVSRAVRTPSRAEDDVRINQQPGPAPGSIVALFGDRSFESEELVAYELGYRVQPLDQLSFDLATFYNDYHNLRTLVPGNPFIETSPAPPHLIIPFGAGNDLTGETYGAEISATWQALDWWRWTASYTYLQMQIHAGSSRPDHLSERAMEGSSPHHQVSLRSRMDLPNNIELDGAIRYVDVLPALNVKSYMTMDLRLAWRPRPNVEISVTGQSLFDDRHLEFAPTTIATQKAEVERAVYGKVTWSF